MNRNTEMIINEVIFAMSWKPLLEKSEAEQWNSGSSFQQTFYHGTNDSESIKRRGFVESEDEVNDHTGISFSEDERYASGYGKILSCKIYVKNPFEVNNEFWNGKGKRPQDKKIYDKVGEDATIGEMSLAIEQTGYDCWFSKIGGLIKEIRIFDKRRAVVFK